MKGDCRQDQHLDPGQVPSSTRGVTARWQYLVTRGQTDGDADMDNDGWAAAEDSDSLELNRGPAYA